jgi:dTDP-4-amino-4,6-dideoxygalactose transaminase
VLTFAEYYFEPKIWDESEHLQRNTTMRRQWAEESVAALESTPWLQVPENSHFPKAPSLPLPATDSALPIARVIEELHDLGIEARRVYEPLHRRFELSSSEFQTTKIPTARLTVLPLTGSLSSRQRLALTRLLSV